MVISVRRNSEKLQPKFQGRVKDRKTSVECNQSATVEFGRSGFASEE